MTSMEETPADAASVPLYRRIRPWHVAVAVAVVFVALFVWAQLTREDVVVDARDLGIAVVARRVEQADERCEVRLDVVERTSGFTRETICWDDERAALAVYTVSPGRVPRFERELSESDPCVRWREPFSRWSDGVRGRRADWVRFEECEPFVAAHGHAFLEDWRYVIPLPGGGEAVGWFVEDTGDGVGFGVGGRSVVTVPTAQIGAVRPLWGSYLDELIATLTPGHEYQVIKWPARFRSEDRTETIEFDVEQPGDPVIATYVGPWFRLPDDEEPRLLVFEGVDTAFVVNPEGTPRIMILPARPR